MMGNGVMSEDLSCRVLNNLCTYEFQPSFRRRDDACFHLSACRASSRWMANWRSLRIESYSYPKRMNYQWNKISNQRQKRLIKWGELLNCEPWDLRYDDCDSVIACFLHTWWYSRKCAVPVPRTGTWYTGKKPYPIRYRTTPRALCDGKKLSARSEKQARETGTDSARWQITDDPAPHIQYR